MELIFTLDSSKYNSTITTHGSHGSLIASVAALSLVSITSHHHMFRSHNTLVINRSQIIARHTPAPPHQHIQDHKHGTRIAVRDLFGNMPVRIKQRVAESSNSSGTSRDWEELRKLVTSLVLAWPSHVCLIVRDGDSDRRIQLRGTIPLDSFENLQSESTLVTHVCNTLSQAGFISSPNHSGWVLTSASTARISIQGVISREPGPTKAAQFVSLGIHPLNVHYGHSVLYDEINRLFENSSFGNQDDSSDIDATERKRRSEDGRHKGEGFTAKELRGSRKGFDRWPMFYIKVELLDAVRHDIALTAEDLVEDKKGGLSSIMELLRAMVLEFLKSHHFRPTSSRLDKVPQKMKSKRGRSSPDGGDISGRQSCKPDQSQRNESPFKTWSRIKSGKPRLTNSIPEKLCGPENMAFHRKNEASVSSASSRKTKVGSSSTPGLNPSLELLNLETGGVQEQYKANSATQSPTISHSGKVIRPPFGDQQLAPSKTVGEHTSIVNNMLAPDSRQVAGEDDFLNWVNPVTRYGSLFNSRTGLVIQPSKTDRLTPRMSSYSEPGKEDRSPLADRVTRNLNEGSSTWIRDVLQGWDNPVYRPTENAISQVSVDVPGNESQQLLHGQHSCSQLKIDRAFRETSAGLAGRISKEALRQAEVISQVDGKFILIKISASSSTSDGENPTGSTDVLVIVDQHAADERCRIEGLLAELCKAPVIDERLHHAAPIQPGVFTTLLDKPISFVMPLREIQLLRTHAQHFADWGIIFHLPPLKPRRDQKQEQEQEQEQKVTVISLPPSIIERCTAVPKLLVELLRSELWKYFEKTHKIDAHRAPVNGIDSTTEHRWLRRIHNCPQALMEMLNSRACRSKAKLSPHCVGRLI
jgi:DNA mismatch repair protein MLH3